VLVGEEDVATVPEKSEFIQKNIAGAVLHRIKGAGHSSCIEQSAEVNRLIRDWLGQVKTFSPKEEGA
jgi:pimeloyl-ACP methyl ester carboxylesterase